MYYSSHASLYAIANYESNLHQNLSHLLQRITGEDESWIIHRDFIGTWTLAPKAVNMPDRKDLGKDYMDGVILSSPSDKWTHACASASHGSNRKMPVAEFRVMSRCSLDFHVLSTLWILKVGHLFDANLTRSAYGNRLRRKVDGSLNLFSMGSFTPYLKPFRDWRDQGISQMRTAVNEGKKVFAITADVSSFYHELNPDFMLDPYFTESVMKINLSPEEAKLHRLFIHALQAWADTTPLKRGLPVGLPASAVVANVALIELDRIIEQQVVPLYYGRYVDDIMLIMEQGTNVRTAIDLWEWIFARSGDKLGWVNADEKDAICFRPDYLTRGDQASRIHFENGKNKVFSLYGESGKTLLDIISHQIHERASEWQAMPRLPHSERHIGTDLLAATQSDGEAADSLRKADGLTMRRAGFAIKLRDFEAYERDLDPTAWQAHRRAFFRAFIEHVLVMPRFFDLAMYLPRVIRLATACEDFGELRKIIDALERLSQQIREDCDIKIKAASSPMNARTKGEMLDRWKDHQFRSVIESIAAAFPTRLSRAGKQAWDAHMASCETSTTLTSPLTAKNFQYQHKLLFSFDLAHIPFRFTGLMKEMISQRGIPARNSIRICTQASELLPDPVLQGVHQLTQWLRLNGLPHGLLFATRPYNLPEIFLLCKGAYQKDQQAALRSVVIALRGFSLSDSAPLYDKNGVLQVPNGIASHKYRLAVASWQTRLESWTAAVKRMPDPDTDRYARLLELLDGVISQSHNCRYLILPELALPAHWFMRIARKLQRRGISLITGIEYLHAGKSRVRNQVWAALSHHGLGYSTFIVYRQDKQRPALNEELELRRLAGLEMKPETTWNKDTPPVIRHGDFQFALLVCSELTNIGYRTALRGKVDALFVPEWNRDIETFNTLVESAALDVHTYIIQCNDRQYGDSRIRAPYKDSWKRDVLRVKGGLSDYCVIGEIDVRSLRQFQSSHRSPAQPFKPTPDGFILDHSRKVLPV